MFSRALEGLGTCRQTHGFSGWVQPQLPLGASQRQKLECNSRPQVLAVCASLAWLLWAPISIYFSLFQSSFSTLFLVLQCTLSPCFVTSLSGQTLSLKSYGFLPELLLSSQLKFLKVESHSLCLSLFVHLTTSRRSDSICGGFWSFPRFSFLFFFLQGEKP